jgi:hypothetical protein
MPDLWVLATIACIGMTSYALRVGGFAVAGIMPATGPVQRFLRLAPGNLFVAFLAAGCFTGGAPSVAGSLLALLTMVVLHREWAALMAGFFAAGVVALVGG